MRTLTLVALLLAAPLAAAGLPSLPAPAPPTVEFDWSPLEPRAHDVVAFSGRAQAATPVLLHRWSVDGEDGPHRLDATWSTAFPRRGEYVVVYEATDATLATGSAARVLSVANTPPALSFALPASVHRGETLRLAAQATDADGDAVVAWSWSFGDGRAASGREVELAYAELGTFVVALEAVDEAGGAGAAAREVRVVNHPPVASGAFAPAQPRAGEEVVFRATGADPDGGAPLRFRWGFSDGVELEGESVARAFAQAGEHVVTLRAEDAEGGRSAPVELRVPVAP